MSVTPCCRKEYRQGAFSGSYFDIYRCKDCKTLWCPKCGKYSDRCSKCSSQNKEWVQYYNMPR